MRMRPRIDHPDEIKLKACSPIRVVLPSRAAPRPRIRVSHSESRIDDVGLLALAQTILAAGAHSVGFTPTAPARYSDRTYPAAIR